MDDTDETWILHSEAQEERERLTRALKGWWKLARPFKAWGLYRKLRATTEASRKTASERFLRKRLADPALASLNEDQRRAAIVQEDRTLIVAGAGTGKTHTMVAKARDSVRTGIARPEEIAFVTFTRKAAQEIRETMMRRATIATIIAAALASGSASATKTAGESVSEVYEERAEREHRKSWCRWRWVREKMLTRTLAGALLEPCAPPSEEEVKRWRTETEQRQRQNRS